MKLIESRVDRAVSTSTSSTHKSSKREAPLPESWLALTQALHLQNKPGEANSAAASASVGLDEDNKGSVLPVAVAVDADLASLYR